MPVGSPFWVSRDAEPGTRPGGRGRRREGGWILNILTSGHKKHTGLFPQWLLLVVGGVCSAGLSHQVQQSMQFLHVRISQSALQDGNKPMIGIAIPVDGLKRSGSPPVETIRTWMCFAFPDVR